MPTSGHSRVGTGTRANILSALKERTLRTFAVCVLLALLITPVLSVHAKEQPSRSPVRVGDVRTDSRGRSFHAVGALLQTKQLADNAEVGLIAIVWVPVKQAKGTACVVFETVRSDDVVTLTTHCTPAKRGNTLMANFEVGVIESDGDSNEVFDDCRDRHDMKKDATFTCAVDVPQDFN